MCIAYGITVGLRFAGNVSNLIRKSGFEKLCKVSVLQVASDLWSSVCSTIFAQDQAASALHTVLSDALEHYLEIKMLEHKVEAAEFEVSSARQTILPNVSIPETIALIRFISQLPPSNSQFSPLEGGVATTELLGLS